MKFEFLFSKFHEIKKHKKLISLHKASLNCAARKFSSELPFGMNTKKAKKVLDYFYKESVVQQFLVEFCFSYPTVLEIFKKKTMRFESPKPNMSAEKLQMGTCSMLITTPPSKNFSELLLFFKSNLPRLGRKKKEIQIMVILEYFSVFMCDSRISNVFTHCKHECSSCGFSISHCVRWKAISTALITSEEICLVTGIN